MSSRLTDTESGSIGWTWRRCCTYAAWFCLIVYSAFVGMALLEFAAKQYLPTNRPVTLLDWVHVWISAGGCWLVAGAGIVWVLKAVDAAKKCDAWYFANCLAERHKTAWFFRNELRLYAALMIFAFALLGFAGLAFHLSVWSTLAIIASFVCIVSTTRFGAQCKVMIGRTPEECEMKAVKFWMVFWVLSLLFFADSFIMATGFAQ